MVTALSSFFVISKGLRAQRLPVKVGKETMIGHIVSAPHADRRGRRKGFFGRRMLECNKRHPVDRGQLVQMSAVEGLTVKVLPNT
jgi:hypothetical protein